MTVDGHTGVVEAGSAQNHGRKIFVWHEKENGTWHTHSQNLARAKVEKRTGHNIGKQFDVDHKDSNHMNDSDSNLHVMSKHDNIAKENIRRGKEN